MAVTRRVLNAAADHIYAVLADGWTYSDWVVGTAHIRSVDDTWPTPGSHLHHKVGPWPLSIRDKSTVLECEPGRMMLTKVRLWPLGEGHVRITLVPVGSVRTRVTMAEDFVGGPLSWLQNKINDVILHRRNVEALRRLEDLARAEQTADAAP
jgi:polyketide cyclase/dehydrase/lipid transport protein